MNEKVGRRRLGTVLIAAAALIVLVVLGWAAFVFLRPAPALLQGQIEVTTVRVQAKIPGRVQEIAVAEGQAVERDDVVVVLDSTDVDAKLGQAEAALAAAVAQSDKALAGAREEQIRSAQAQLEAAEEQARVAQSTFVRLDRLAAEGVIPTQKRDEAEAQAAAAKAQQRAAEQSLTMARTATRPEDQRAADAQVERARAARAEALSALEETRVRAPLSGEVETRAVEPGEMVAAGSPLLVIADLDDIWLTLNLREDQLKNLRMGDVIRAQIPALNMREADFRISHIAAQADFATWRSTRDLGGFDLRTFEVRARPTEPVEGLRPGMTALLPEAALDRAR